MEPNIVKIPVLDDEEGQIIEMEVDEEYLKEMNRIQEEIEERRKEARRRERELESYERLS